MTAGAYRKCEECGRRVHMNHTCKQWNREGCMGDPWHVRRRAKKKIEELEEKKKFHADKVDRIDQQIQHWEHELNS